MSTSRPGTCGYGTAVNPVASPWEPLKANATLRLCMASGGPNGKAARLASCTTSTQSSQTSPVTRSPPSLLHPQPDGYVSPPRPFPHPATRKAATTTRHEAKTTGTRGGRAAAAPAKFYTNETCTQFARTRWGHRNAPTRFCDASCPSKTTTWEFEKNGGGAQATTTTERDAVRTLTSPTLRVALGGDGMLQEGVCPSQVMC